LLLCCACLLLLLAFRVLPLAGFVLRPGQEALVSKFKDKAMCKESLVEQLIMGAGKTTVVAPLLALILGDGETCVKMVMPSALLEMTRNVMREAFSSIVYKRVYTFNFDRAQEVTKDIHYKLLKATKTRGT
jgi:hypothetical protein